MHVFTVVSSSYIGTCHGWEIPEGSFIPCKCNEGMMLQYLHRNAMQIMALNLPSVHTRAFPLIDSLRTSHFALRSRA